MKNNLRVILLVCAALAIFVLGAIFWNYVRPDRYKIVTHKNNCFKIDTVTGRVWIYRVRSFLECGLKEADTFDPDAFIKANSPPPPPEGFILDKPQQPAETNDLSNIPTDQLLQMIQQIEPNKQ